jgi:hypothetical protein
VVTPSKQIAEQQVIEPAHVTLPVACAYTGDSRSVLYKAIGRGEVEAFKEGNRTLLVFESLKKRVAARKPATIGAGDPKFRELHRLSQASPKRRKRRTRSRGAV